MENLFLRIAAISLTSSAVLLPLLLFSRYLCGRYAAKTCYFLWLVLALRLVLPVQFTLPEPVVTVEAPSYTIAVPAAPRQAPQSGTVSPVQSPAAQSPASGGTVQPAVPETAAPARTVSLTRVLAAIWLAGTGVFLAGQSAAYLLARRLLLRRAKPAEAELTAELNRLARALGIRGKVALFRSTQVSSPMLLGLVRPVVLLPAGAEPGPALEVMLRHELTHLRRRDVVYKLLLLLANAVHWFNPLVWWMSREASRNLELCCDDDVVRNGGEGFRRLYGEVLIQTAAARGRGPLLSTQFGGEKAQMKGRLKNLFQKKKNSVLLVCVILAAALLTGSLVACTASRGRVSEDEAIDLLTGSIQYDAQAGRLSFTVPNVDTPSQPWQILISGRAEFADGMSMSLHYHTDTQWEPGESYYEDLGEVADNLTELTMDVTLGEAERSIDLLPYLQVGPIYVSNAYGFTVRFPNSWAGKVGFSVDSDDLIAVFQKNPGQDGSSSDPVLLNLCVAAQADFDALYGDKDLDGIYENGGPRITVLGYVGERVVYLHIDPLPEGVGPDMEEYARLHQEAEALTSAIFTAHGSGAPEYRNDVYGFTLALPESWAGYYEVREKAEGYYWFCYTDLEDALLAELSVYDHQAEELSSRTVFLGTDGTSWLYLSCAQEDSRLAMLAPEDETRVRWEQMEEDLKAESGVTARFDADTPIAVSTGGVYTSTAYGFTIRPDLPGEWGQYLQFSEFPDGHGEFACIAPGLERVCSIASVEVYDQLIPEEELPARMQLAGGREGCWVYLSFYQSDLPTLSASTQEARDIYDTLYNRLQYLPGGALSFSDYPSGGEDPALSAYQDVLLRGREFTVAGEGRSLDFSRLHEVVTTDSNVQVETPWFSVVDLDRDGTQELVVWINANGWSWGALILRWQDGVIYGYPIWVRAFMEVKTDGTFSYSSGAFDNGFSTIRFTEDGYETDPFTYCYTGEGYVVDHVPATEKEFKTAGQQQNKKPDVAYYDFTAENIAHILREMA